MRTISRSIFPLAPPPCLPHPCQPKGAATATPAESLRKTLEAMDRHNIVLGFLGGADLSIVQNWHVRPPSERHEWKLRCVRRDIVAVGAAHSKRVPRVDDLDLGRPHHDRDEIGSGWRHTRLVAIEHDRAHQRPSGIVEPKRVYGSDGCLTRNRHEPYLPSTSRTYTGGFGRQS